MMMRRKPLLWMAGCLLAMTTAAVPLLAQEWWQTHPRNLVWQAVKNEDRDSAKKMYFMFRDTKRKKNGDVETKEMLQTPLVTLGRIIAINGHPLSAEQKSKEDGRLNRLNDSDELQKK